MVTNISILEKGNPLLPQYPHSSIRHHQGLLMATPILAQHLKLPPSHLRSGYLPPPGFIERFLSVICQTRRRTHLPRHHTRQQNPQRQRPRAVHQRAPRRLSRPRHPPRNLPPRPRVHGRHPRRWRASRRVRHNRNGLGRR